ncbi:ADP-ribosylation factor-like protein 6-interacting protein 4 isoform X1 [Tympanuchus pallidicinctus]|uniref:ADP-ribosylation factor-like protein 6-interacting protein 4 isoform X1 n=1 Tax=Tympanuchus pallidicinctus TaxID=109042 RepID=UPI0022873C06|nr:ADP-ribosylation factor-like protein 6-interacting protein 4 isoform X1 [Tympanuchus pallidicinctus]
MARGRSRKRSRSSSSRSPSGSGREKRGVRSGAASPGPRHRPSSAAAREGREGPAPAFPRLPPPPWCCAELPLCVAGRKKEGRKKKKRKANASSSDSSSSSRSSSSSSSTSSSDSDTRAKRHGKRKRGKHKDKKKKKKIKKKLKKSKERVKEDRGVSEALPGPSLELWQKEPQVDPGPVLTDEQKSRIQAMKPMTKEEWDARQSVIRRVVDPETGRTRLIKGDGEVLEEIVSKERHKEINKQATRGDGLAFQVRTGMLQ